MILKRFVRFVWRSLSPSQNKGPVSLWAFYSISAAICLSIFLVDGHLIWSLFMLPVLVLSVLHLRKAIARREWL